MNKDEARYWYKKERLRVEEEQQKKHEDKDDNNETEKETEGDKEPERPFIDKTWVGRTTGNSISRTGRYVDKDEE